MNVPRTTLEQWRVLQAIVEAGGFVQAAKMLNRSQSAVSYAVNSLQEQLGIPLLEIQGRKAVLTAPGRALLRRAHDILGAAEELEAFAERLKQGLESELWISVDSFFPTSLMTEALREFRGFNASIKLQIRESLMCRQQEGEPGRNADVVIGTRVPESGLGDALLSVPLCAVAVADHPLHAIDGPCSLAQLAAHMQIAVCEAGTLNPADRGWMNSRSRWIASSLQQVIELVRSGLGYAWLPTHMIVDEIARGELKPLRLHAGEIRSVQIYVTLANPETGGPASARFVEIVRRLSASWKGD
ncbi:MAG: LysR family transcriptional regulator [Burkholderiaceae bacterium]